MRWGYLSLIVATAFWGGNFVYGKLLSQAVSPISLTFLRWLPAFLILFLLYHRPTLQAVKSLKSGWGVMWSLGVLGVVLFSLTLYQGLKTAPVLNASLYLAVVPALVLLWNRLFFNEKIPLPILFGTLLSLFGTFWLLSQGELSRLLNLNINYGDLWAVGSAVSWSIYCCVIRLRPANISNTVFLTILVGVALIVLTPLFLLEVAFYGANFLQELTASQWLGVGYLVIGPSVLAYAFWNFGIAQLGSSRGAVMTNFTPLFAALCSIVFLDEQVQSFHLISALFIGIGVWICSSGKRK